MRLNVIVQIKKIFMIYNISDVWSRYL